MLSFKEFQEYVMDHIREYLPEEYANAEVSVRTVQKLNGVTLQGLEIWTPEMKQGTGVTPTIYLNGIYENYENGVDLESLWNISAILRDSQWICRKMWQKSRKCIRMSIM